MSSADLQQEAQQLLQQLSNIEKASLCTGRTFWDLNGVERLDLPSIMMTDGPHGLRKQSGDSDHIGLSGSVPAVCFPSGAGLASSWNRNLLREVGVALGEECLQEKVSVLLGPGINIKRSPLCGRNFEYFSEDPYLSGEMAKNWVQGVQSKGIGTSLKHFAANNQESHRLVVDTVVDERTLREIYLPGFEITVKDAQPWTLMCSYNLLNGVYLAENKHLLTDILKQEWGHTGLVVTDWGAANNRVQGLAAGLEIDMPGNAGAFTSRILAAIETGELEQGALDRAATRVIELILKSKPALESQHQYDESAHHSLARRAAEEACVLLKNDDALLPLPRSGSIGVVGAMAKTPRYQGAGSSQITPTQIDIPLEEITRLLPAAEVPLYAAGYNLGDDGTDNQLLEEALSLASEVNTVILFAGLPDAYESEGFDRDHMRLPTAQLELIDRLADVAQRLVLVLQNGAPVEMPFKHKVPAILETYLGGQAGGSAVARVLFGEASPGGRLAESFPEKLEDVPCHSWFPGEPRQVQYRESIWVGYRYFCSAQVPVSFPFGHGLSYTSFDYRDLRVAGAVQADQQFNCDTATLSDWAGLRIECEIENTGERGGWETAQLYVHDKASAVHRPRRELKGFDKVWLNPGEVTTVSFEIGRRALAYWDTANSCWSISTGGFEFEVGASSQDIRLSCEIGIVSADKKPSANPALQTYFEPGRRDFNHTAFTALFGEAIPPVASVKPYHLNSTLGEVSETRVGRMLIRQIKKTLAEAAGPDVDEKVDRMINAMVWEMPLRSIVIMSGGKVSFKVMAVMIHLMNHQFGKALRTAITGDVDNKQAPQR